MLPKILSPLGDGSDSYVVEHIISLENCSINDDNPRLFFDGSLARDENEYDSSADDEKQSTFQLLWASKNEEETSEHDIFFTVENKQLKQVWTFAIFFSISGCQNKASI